jgi:glycosyltransferase involved in cell wall biosynthesis
MVHRRIARETSRAKRAFFRFEWKALERYEAAQCPKFDANIVMSDDDAALLSNVAPGTAFTTVGNGVDTAYFTPVTLQGHRKIVFAGRLDQYSNRDGLMAFARDVWPKLRDLYQDATLDVIGSHPPPELLAMAQSDARLRVHGFVPDIRPYFSEAGLALCPVRDGGGTRIKVLDALAMGVPLVATSIGCEGLDVSDGRHVLIADSSAEFLQQIRRVFENPVLAAHLASEGRALVTERYSWDFQANQLLQVYDRVTAGRAPAAAVNSASQSDTMPSVL